MVCLFHWLFSSNQISYHRLLSASAFIYHCHRYKSMATMLELSPLLHTCTITLSSYYYTIIVVKPRDDVSLQYTLVTGKSNDGLSSHDANTISNHSMKGRPPSVSIRESCMLPSLDLYQSGVTHLGIVWVADTSMGLPKTQLLQYLPITGPPQAVDCKTIVLQSQPTGMAPQCHTALSNAKLPATPNRIFRWKSTHFLPVKEGYCGKFWRV